MKAVFRHELSSYFTNISGYVFGAFLLLFAGIYTMVYNLKSAVTNFEYVPGSMCFVFLIIVPILTMRILAEERRQKTDQLLYSLPLTMTEIILGKYAAMLIMLLIPCVVMCAYPLMLSAYGNVYLPAAFSAMVGFFFLGAALLAIGMFISAVTESQAVAAGLCFAVMLVNYFLAALSSYVSTSAAASMLAFAVLILVLAIVFRILTKNTLVSAVLAVVLEAGLITSYLLKSSLYEGLFPDVMESLSLFERFNTFIDGVFDITGLIYLASVAGVFLYLSVQAMEKRRWSE